MSTRTTQGSDGTITYQSVNGYDRWVEVEAPSSPTDLQQVDGCSRSVGEHRSLTLAPSRLNPLASLLIGLATLLQSFYVDQIESVISGAG